MQTKTLPWQDLGLSQRQLACAMAFLCTEAERAGFRADDDGLDMAAIAAWAADHRAEILAWLESVDP